MTPTTTDISNLLSQSAQTITAQSKSNFSSAFFFLSPEKQEAMRHVYAFFRMVDDVVDEESNPQKQREMIAFWRDCIVNMETRQHAIPVLQGLKKCMDRFHIPRELFLELISGCEMDIEKKRYENFEELYRYCYLVASVVGLVCMKIFEYESPTSTKMAVDLGLALQLTNIIRDVGVDLKKDRIYLPQDELNRFGVTANDLITGKATAPFKALMEFQYERAMQYYRSSFLEFSKDSGGKLLAAKIMGKVYRQLLEKIRNKHYPVLKQRIRFNTAEKMFLLGKILAKHYLFGNQA